MTLFKWMGQQTKYENVAYAVLWGLLFAAPVMMLYARTIDNAEAVFDWHEVWMLWRTLGVYLLLFAIHNFLLAPMLMNAGRRWLYLGMTAVVLALFVTYQCNMRPERHRPHNGMAMNWHDHKPPFADDGERMPHEMDNGHGWHHDRDRHPKTDRPDMMHRRNRHLSPMDERDIVATVVLVLMFGMNLGVKFYFRSQRDRQKMKQLEHNNLQQQLEYLKYQINPHFFMNTLNNIHALVDIDPTKAQESIVELSKMMRFVLYEGNKHDMPLQREFEFIGTYIKLMRLRYTDRVSISLSLPVQPVEGSIPPLLLITFVENAFKHGISYQQESFVDVKIAVDERRLRFECRNSKALKPNGEKGGVGLTNVKQRLRLLYDNNFTLDITD